MTRNPSLTEQSNVLTGHSGTSTDPEVLTRSPPPDFVEVQARLMHTLNDFVLKLAQPPPKPRESRLAWLNCPFVVTVLGGVIASMLTLTWQHRAAQRQREW